MRRGNVLGFLLLALLAGCNGRMFTLPAVMRPTPVAAASQNPDDSDWLIARHEGRWELVKRGDAGRVEKSALNEEVLRLGPNSTVLVLSMPAIGEGQEIQCPESERNDYRMQCSSAFLVCSHDSASPLGTPWGYDACYVDTNAVLEAAMDVGMIARILPEVQKPGTR